MNDLDLVTKDLTTTSLAIAELFGREHKNILRTIRNIISDMSVDDLTQLKIEQCFYINELAKVKLLSGKFLETDERAV